MKLFGAMHTHGIDIWRKYIHKFNYYFLLKSMCFSFWNFLSPKWNILDFVYIVFFHVIINCFESFDFLYVVFIYIILVNLFFNETSISWIIILLITNYRLLLFRRKIIFSECDEEHIYLILFSLHRTIFVKSTKISLMYLFNLLFLTQCFFFALNCLFIILIKYSA